MAWSSPCRLCSGLYNFRKDKGLKDIYRAIKGNKEKIAELVDYSPCAAVKLCLVYEDKDIAKAFFARYENDTGRLPFCDRRRDLISEHMESRGIERLPYLANLAAMVESSLLERGGGSASAICGLKSMEDVFGRENPSYDDFQQMLGLLAGLLVEDRETEKFSLKKRLHRHAGS